MTKTQIFEAALRLPPQDRAELRHELAQLDADGWMDEDDPLSDTDKALIDTRMAEHERNPGAAIPWAEFSARLQRRLDR